MTFKNISTYNEPTLQILDTEMRINVAQLLKEPVGSSRRYQINESVGKEGIDSVNGNITLARTNHGILVKGAMIANVTGICCRCLSAINCTVDFCLEEEFLPRVGIPSDLALPGEADDSTTIDDNHVLDLSEVMRQYTLLAMPAKLLCRTDCAGLCPSCGHNLNQGLCHCSSGAHDQRWPELVRLGKESEV